MTTLQAGWRREPLKNCPICHGAGEVSWRLSSTISPTGWKCIGRKKPKPPKKKGALLIAESDLSIKQRGIWKEYGLSFDGSCACVIMPKVDFVQLKRTASQLQRIAHNERVPHAELDDPLDDLFPGPYLYPEFLQ